MPGKSAIYFLPESKNLAWDGLVFSEEIFQEVADKNQWNGVTRFAAYVCDPAFEPRRKSPSHSESNEPQEPCDDGPVSAFAQPRTGKGRQRSQAVGRLKMGRRSVRFYVEISIFRLTKHCVFCRNNRFRNYRVRHKSSRKRGGHEENYSPISPGRRDTACYCNGS